MKKTLLIAGALLALSASMATAGGVNLSWTDCGAFGQDSRTSACTNNAIKGALYGSAIAPTPINFLNGQTGTVDLQTTGASLSNWWQMGAGGCRVGAFTVSMDFTTDTGNCFDIWGGGASPGSNYAPGWCGPNRARLKATGAVASPLAADDATEMYLWKMSFLGSKTFGGTACVGCLDGACFVLNDQFLTQPLNSPGGDVHINNPLLRQHVSWQASGASIPGGCPGGTPTKNATWGSVKSLYR
jgi:hypothetical protein